jgi:hydrophobic/amphiphilic exporter-1 (mainly G- bacteria), HAE1 family
MAKFFINRPIVAMVISIVLVLVGLIVMRGLPISQFPDIVPPMINVTTTFVGASAVDVEQSVATPLEQQVNGVENMIYMKSINANDGTLTLQVSFDVGSNLDMSNVLTQNRVSQAQASLPSAVKNYGVIVKKSLVFPLLLVTLTSPNGTYDNNFLSNYAAINVNDLLSRTKGVGDVKLFGGSDYAMRLWVKPDRLAKMGLTVPDLVRAVQDQNVIAPAGQVGGPPAPPGTDFTYTVRTSGRLMNEEEFANIVIRTNPDGSQVRMRDVARTELGTLLYNQVGRNNGRPAAVIAVFQLPGSNALEVAASIKETLQGLSRRFPPDMAHEISLDTTLAIEEGISEIVTTLFEAVLLVILVVFVFLQNWRATLIPLITVPVSLIATFIVFPLLGFSINTLSLLGMVLAIGIVVDDAIVVVEAVMHNIEKGLSPREATLKAMQEVSGPVIAIALILAAVFVPVAFISGITGRLYQQFAITIAISVLFSAFNALTLSPALAAMLLRPKAQSKSFLDPFYNWFNRIFERFTGGYLSVTSILIRKMARSLIFIGVLLVAVVFLFRIVPVGFVPEEDNGYFLISLQLPDASGMQRTDAVAREVEAILAEQEAIGSYTTVVGMNIMTNTVASNFCSFFVALKPWEERTHKEERSFELVEALNKRFAAEVPEGLVMAFGPPAIQGLGTGAGFTMFIQDQSGGTPAQLQEQTTAFITAARKRPEIGRIATFYRAAVPQLYADIDRDKVLKMGASLSDVNTTLGSLLGANYINDFNRFGRVYKVYLSSEPEYRNEVWDLGQFYVRSSNGAMIPLSALVTMRSITGPEYTNRFNLYRSAELTGVPAAGYSSAQALAALQEVARETLPPGWSFDWANMSYQEIKAAGKSAVVFIAALIFVFLILSAQYESWSLPMSVLLATPFVVFGAMLGLFVARFASDSYVNNVFAQIGFVTLIGLSAKNAILIVEFAKMKREAGAAPMEAALESAKLRLRPILMTSFAFILGVVPLVRAAGAGAEARKVMGLAVFSGLLVATALGILLIPMLYVMVESYFVRAKPGSPPTGPAGAGPELPTQKKGH